MRKWTQSIKLTLSEAINAEVDHDFRNEVNSANPSAEPLTGMLSDEQKRTVEERSNAKFDVDLKKAYAGVVAKAEQLIKLQVPAAYKVKKGNSLMKALRKKLSMNVQNKMDEEKKLHIMVEQSTSKKDSEYDWTDRLKQWKKVQMAEGAIVDLGAKGSLNS